MNNQFRYKTTISGIALVLSIMTAACGSSDSSKPATSNPTTAASTTTGSVTTGSSALSLSPTGVSIPVGSTYQFYASGGTAPYSYYLPTGSSYATVSSTGLVTAVAAASNIQIMVTDATGATSSATFSTTTSTGTGVGTLAISPNSQSLSVGSSLTLIASGGSTPYTFYLSSGSGTVSAISSNSATFTSSTATNAQVAVRDSAGNTAYASITVSGSSAPVSLTYYPSMNAGASQTVSVTGGVAPYTYFVVYGGGSISANSDSHSATYVAPSGASSVQIGVQDYAGTRVYSNPITVSAASSTATCAGNYNIYEYSSTQNWTGTMHIDQYSGGYFTGTMYFAGSGLGYGYTQIYGYCYSNGAMSFTRNGPFGGSGGVVYQYQSYTGTFYNNGSRTTMSGSFTGNNQSYSWNAYSY